MTSSDRPETLMARFLMATVLHDRVTRERLRADLVTTRWHDAAGVVDGALAVAMVARFGDSPGLDDLRTFIRKTVRYFRNPRLDPHELETVLRSALGENIPVEGIPAGRVEGLKMLIFGGVVRDLDLSPADVGRLLVRAESWAAERGFRPTVAAP